MTSLSGVMVVTGAASGIGRVSALHFAACGATVVGADINAFQAEAKNIHPIVADLTQEEDCRKVATSAESLGTVRGLFNCAGLELHGNVETTPLAEWNKVIAVNLTALYLLSKFVVPLLRKAGGGAILNMSSIQGIATQKDVVAYAASKGAAIALTRAMALDHGADRIRVNAICPGTIETPLVAANARYFNPQNPQSVLDEWGSKHALNRIGQPIEVAKVAAFLLSDDATFVTGAHYLVDGGLLASY
jgi:NAD(P)-dependent dehydrogenase (short-subunit alcohol dehydrogenase family)